MMLQSVIELTYLGAQTVRVIIRCFTHV